MSEQLRDQQVHGIEKIEKLDNSAKVEMNPVDDTQEIVASKSKFDGAMQRADDYFKQGQQVAAVNTETVRTSPIQEMEMFQRKIQRLGPATADATIARAEQVQETTRATTNRVEEAMKTMPADAKLSPVFEGPLSERLVHIDSSLRSALGMFDAEAKAAPVQPKTGGENPLTKFLGYLTHGDQQLGRVVTEIQHIQQIEPEKLTPAKLLAVQVKLGFVQQELEFFTNVLNKALESTKTIMNIQV